MPLNIHSFFMSLHEEKKTMTQHCFQIKQMTLGIEDIPNNLRSPKHQVSKLTIKITFQYVIQ